MNTIEKGITTLIRSAITGERYPLPEDFVLGQCVVIGVILNRVNNHLPFFLILLPGFVRKWAGD